MFKHILLPLDGGVLAECVLPHAVALANSLDASVTVLQVLEDDRNQDAGRSIDPLEWRLRQATAAAYLAEVARRLKAEGVETEQALVEGQPAARIVQYVHDHEVDLVMLSSHGRSGLSPWNVNSVVQKTIQMAGCSTMIVRAYQSKDQALGGLRYRRIMLPMDGSARAECTLPVARQLAQQHQAELLVAQVVTKPEMPGRALRTHQEIELAEQLTDANRREAVRYLDQLHSRLWMDSEIRLAVSDDVVSSLHEVAASEDVDLVIMSAHGYSGKAQWPYGHVTSNFIYYGTTPLLVIQDLEPEKARSAEVESILQSSEALAALPLGSRAGANSHSSNGIPVSA